MFFYSYGISTCILYVLTNSLYKLICTLRHLTPIFDPLNGLISSSHTPHLVQHQNNCSKNVGVLLFLKTWFIHSLVQGLSSTITFSGYSSYVQNIFILRLKQVTCKGLNGSKWLHFLHYICFHSWKGCLH